jgi:hypothetical protein
VFLGSFASIDFILLDDVSESTLVSSSGLFRNVCVGKQEFKVYYISGG